MITDYAKARAGALEYLSISKTTITASKSDPICLLGGHKAEDGVIAECAICQVSGCISCLDTHDCEDYDKEIWVA